MTRLTVWKSLKTDPIRAQWLIVLIVVDAVSGGICALAPAGDASAGWLYISSGLLLASATLVAEGYSVSGGVAGAFGWGAVLATVLLATDRWTALAGVVVVALCLPATCHALIMFEVGLGLDRAREYRMSRRR